MAGVLDLVSSLSEPLEGLLGANVLQNEADQLKNIGTTAAQNIQQAGAQASDSLAFKPVTVTSSLGSTSVDPSGNINLNVNQQGQAIQQGLQGQAQQMIGQAPVTQESLFNQLQAAQAPELQRQRDSMESRLRAQGRLGLSSSAYGGSPEQLAFEKAAQEATAGNFFQAAQLAPQLQGQNLQNIQSSLASSFLPENQVRGLLSPSATFSQLGQAAQTAQADALLKSIIQGEGIRSQTGIGAADLAAKLGEAQAQAYGGLFAAAAPKVVELGSEAGKKLLELLSKQQTVQSAFPEAGNIGVA